MWLVLDWDLTRSKTERHYFLLSLTSEHQDFSIGARPQVHNNGTKRIKERTSTRRAIYNGTETDTRYAYKNDQRKILKNSVY